MARPKRSMAPKSTEKESKRKCAPSKQRSQLLQLMGFPGENEDSYAKTETARADWQAVVERLSSHPEEAAIADPFGTIPTGDMHSAFRNYPLTLALVNRRTPLTREALKAFLKAYPDIVRKPRSPLAIWASKNPELCRNIPDIIDILKGLNPHMCGLQRTRTYEIMGFSSDINQLSPVHNISLYNSYQMGLGDIHRIDWQAFENHLRENPEEAKILCPVESHYMLLFPLETALHFRFAPPPLSTVQLLLELCPEAVTIDDSCVLVWACSLPQQDGPEVIRAVLNANPALASLPGQLTSHHVERQTGLPLHTVVCFSRFAAPIVPDLLQAYPEAIADRSSYDSQTPLQIVTDPRWSRRLPTDLLRSLLEYSHRHNVGTEADALLFLPEKDVSKRCPMDALHEEAWLYRRRKDERGEECFHNLCLGFQAAGAFKAQLTVEAMWEYPLLHAAIELARQQWFIFKVLRDHTTPADLFRRDPSGRIPLAVAIERAGNDDDQNDGGEIDFSSVMKWLLDDNRNGSSQTARIPVDANDTLPLHRALHVGLYGASEDHLAPAFPDALSIPDPETNLIPCLLAAVGEESCVKTIFGLMIMRPDLIASMCSRQIRMSEGQ